MHSYRHNHISASNIQGCRAGKLDGETNQELWYSFIYVSMGGKVAAGSLSGAKMKIKRCNRPCSFVIYSRD